MCQVLISLPTRNDTISEKLGAFFHDYQDVIFWEWHVFTTITLITTKDSTLRSQRTHHVNLTSHFAGDSSHNLTPLALQLLPLRRLRGDFFNNLHSHNLMSKIHQFHGDQLNYLYWLLLAKASLVLQVSNTWIWCFINSSLKNQCSELQKYPDSEIDTYVETIMVEIHFHLLLHTTFTSPLVVWFWYDATY